VATLEVLLCGRWFILVLCGVCRGNKMIETSRAKKGYLRNSELSFLFFVTWTAAFQAPCD
jgi:hypothetical protein